MGGDLYIGNGFSVSRHGDDWTIWRYFGPAFGDTDKQELTLTTEGMDELRDYFAEFYEISREEG